MKWREGRRRRREREREGGQNEKKNEFYPLWMRTFNKALLMHNSLRVTLKVEILE